MSTPQASETHTYTLTPAQLSTLRFAVQRVFAEYLEHARDRATRQEPEAFDIGIVDAFVDLAQVFDIEIPEV